MRMNVGIDVAKEMHWVTAIDPDGVVQTDRKLANTPSEIAGLIQELGEKRGSVGPCASASTSLAASPGLAEAMLAEAEIALVNVPGLAVNRARRTGRRREQVPAPRRGMPLPSKSARCSDLRTIEPDAELQPRGPTPRRPATRPGADGQTQRGWRVRDLLVGVFPGFDRAASISQPRGRSTL